MRLYNYDLEAHLLSGLIQFPDIFFEISAFVSEKDFYSEYSSVNKSIFLITKSFIEEGKPLDEVLIAEKIKLLGIKFEEGLDCLEYIQGLVMRKIGQKSIIQTAKELKLLTVRRGICDVGKDLNKSMQSSNADSYQEIVEIADKIYHDNINVYESGEGAPQNIYETMEEIIEERGDNPIDDFGLEGPHQRLHEIYGSLLRPGNITVIVARSGIGKTQFCMDFCTKVSAMNDHVPVLHFDNGEMSLEELTMRQCAALSGVQLSLLETGRWRQAGDEVVNKIRKVWKTIKSMQFYYYNCGGLSTEEMVNVIKRFYYSKVGRGNQMVFSFDYIKTTFEKQSNKNEWQIVGEMVDRFKKLISKEILQDSKPLISMITSVQMNRTGTSRNRSSDNIVEDETVVSLSDRITQFCSHMFLLRGKEPAEIAEHSNFGTHKLTNIKSRHLGQDPMGEIQPVRMADGGLRRNYVNFDFNNFNITERGDLRDLVEHLRVEGISPEEDGEDSLPSLFND
jgi:replicative DNA helicase